MVLHTVRRRPEQPEVIPNQYIVVFKPTVTSEQRAAHRAWAAERHFSTQSARGYAQGTYGLVQKFNICDGQLCGYTAHVPEDIAREINDTDEVDFVEPDYKVYAMKVVQQENAPSWGLARLSSKTKLTEETKTIYHYDDQAAGEGTTAYIIDTGILAEHDDFEGRATFGFNTVPGSSDTDMNGHGTHCAGTIGSKTHGVAKRVNLIGVKVLGDNGEGSNSSVIAGIRWATEDAQSRGITKCVANMSLGGPTSRAVNQAVRTAIRSGLTICVAAGNEGLNASTASPASEPTAITVGAVGEDDRVPNFSNWGSLVDISAPGVGITSTWIDESGGGATDKTLAISGTSMAAPHVTGLAAYLISKDPSLNTPAKVTSEIKSLGLTGQIVKSTLQRGTTDLLAHNGEIGSPAAGPAVDDS